jgi:hypothetical protein
MAHDGSEGITMADETDRDEMELILADVQELVKLGMIEFTREGGLVVTDRGVAMMSQIQGSVWN